MISNTRRILHRWFRLRYFDRSSHRSKMTCYCLLKEGVYRVLEKMRNAYQMQSNYFLALDSFIDFIFS